jgi:hypothetical protein
MAPMRDAEIHLPNGFKLTFDLYRDAYMLEHAQAGMAYAIRDPRGFSNSDTWIDHVERTANVRPGTFHSALTGALHGQHRGASASLYGGPIASARQSSGGSSASALQALHDALRSGKISLSEFRAHYDAMTYPGLTPLGGLGSNGSAQAAAAMQARYKAQAYAALQAHVGIGGAPSPPHPPTALKSEGVRAGEIIAWRAWFVSGDDLRSVVAEGKSWSATEPMVGDAAAGYGVHAYKGPHGPVLDKYVTRDHSQLWVIGEVAMWGDVIEHAEGYRSEFARVHSLVTWHEKVPAFQREAIRKKYLEVVGFKLDDAA